MNTINITENTINDFEFSYRQRQDGIYMYCVDGVDSISENIRLKKQADAICILKLKQAKSILRKNKIRAKHFTIMILGRKNYIYFDFVSDHSTEEIECLLSEINFPISACKLEKF